MRSILGAQSTLYRMQYGVTFAATARDVEVARQTSGLGAPSVR